MITLNNKYAKIKMKNQLDNLKFIRKINRQHMAFFIFKLK